MKLPHIIFSRKPHQSALPTITTDQRGMVRMLTGDGSTTDDELWFGANDAATLEWRKVAMAEDVSEGFAPIGATYITQTANANLTAEQALGSLATGLMKVTTTTGVVSSVAAPAGAVVGDTDAQTLTNKTLTTPTIGSFANANHTHDNSAGGGFVPYYYATFGPFFINDLPGTATTAFQAPFFDTATTVLRSTMDVYMPVAGEIVGIWVISDANRTAGDVTINPVVNGVSQTLDGGAVCKLDGTNTRRHGVTVTRGNGEDFALGNRISLEAVSASWTPITADLTAWMMVRFDVGV